MRSCKGLLCTSAGARALGAAARELQAVLCARRAIACSRDFHATAAVGWHTRALGAAVPQVPGAAVQFSATMAHYGTLWPRTMAQDWIGLWLVGNECGWICRVGAFEMGLGRSRWGWGVGRRKPWVGLSTATPFSFATKLFDMRPITHKNWVLRRSSCSPRSCEQPK